MTWLLTFSFAGDIAEMALDSLTEVFEEISRELAIPLAAGDLAALNALMQHEHAIELEVIPQGALRRLPVDLVKAWEARHSNHTKLALEADIKRRAAA